MIQAAEVWPITKEAHGRARQSWAYNIIWLVLSGVARSGAFLQSAWPVNGVIRRPLETHVVVLAAGQGTRMVTPAEGDASDRGPADGRASFGPRFDFPSTVTLVVGYGAVPSRAVGCRPPAVRLQEPQREPRASASRPYRRPGRNARPSRATCRFAVTLQRLIDPPGRPSGGNRHGGRRAPLWLTAAS